MWTLVCVLCLCMGLYSTYEYSCYQAKCICRVSPKFHADCSGTDITDVDLTKFSRAEKRLLDYIDMSATPFCSDRPITFYYKRLLMVCLSQTPPSSTASNTSASPIITTTTTTTYARGSPPCFPTYTMTPTTFLPH